MKNGFIIEQFCKLQRLQMELKLIKKRKNKHSVFWVIVAFIKLRKNSKKSKHRRYVLQQWLLTERTYNANLDLAIKHIKQPLVAHKLIDKEGISILCPQFEQMKQLSNMMMGLVSIVEKQKNPNKIIIGKQLIRFGNFYKLYYTYFGNRLKSEQLIRKLFQQNQPVMRQIEQRFKSAAKSVDPRKQNMTISDCLEQPQYRMFKYVLLLRSYISKLQKWHPDSQQMRKALALYEDINDKNNDLMGRLQAQAKKIKLDRLFGKSIQDSSHYIVQMTADSLYFPAKMYIFSNLVIVSAVQNMLGFMDQRRFINIELNQFSIAQKKPDAKYFKNGLLLCGQYRALHFFTQDSGSRQEIVATLQKVVKELQTKATQKRQQKALGIEVTKKLSFVINMGPAQVFAPQFRVQVLQIEVRPLGTFSNDTVYLTRFAGPLWWQDLAAVGLQQGKIKRGIWQLIEVHMSQVTQLLAHLRQKYPEVEFPQVDPLTKQINLVTQGKKNTKMYQVRGYLLQQFFNFIFRHPTVMGSPLQIISKYKILQPFWKYLIDKNNYLLARGDSCKQQPNLYQYGENHCKICAFVLKADLQVIQQFRYDVMRSGNNKDTCFNALNLLRLRFVGMQQKFFDTVQKVLLRELLECGRIDYSLIQRSQVNKRQQYLPIQGCGESKQFSLIGDYKKKVGQYIIDLGSFIGLGDALDCRLLLRYGGNQRILDQDEVIFELIAKYELPAEQRQNQSRSSRASFNLTSIQKEQSIFSGLISFFKSKINSSLAFRKIIYLPKQVEIKSMEKSINRGEYVINELYSRLSKGEIMFEIDDWGQICALWAVLNLWNQINTRSPNQILDIVMNKLVPPDTHYIFNQTAFTKIFVDAIQNFKKKLGPKPILEKEMASIYKRCLRVFYRTVRTYTYLAPASPHTVPPSLITDGLGPFLQQCCLGVNFKDLLIFRNFKSKQAAIRLNLEDVKTTHTTFSLFIQYGYSMGAAETNCKQAQKITLRFDGRMLFHFDYLLRQYANIRKIFPLTIA